MSSTHALLRKCLRVSLGSLVLGTVLLVLFFFANYYDLEVAFSSIPVVLIMGIANLLLLLRLVWRGRKERESRKALWRAGVIMSFNIPVVLLYSKVVLVLCNTLLVRLVNTTNQPLRHIVVLGCGQQRLLADLPPGQATILWLPISRDCFERTVVVQYAAGKTTQQAVIDGYVVEGRRINLKLGYGQQLAATNR